MEKMKEFMLLFRMSPSVTAPTAEQQATMHQQWQAFIGGIAAAAKLIHVSRLAFEGVLLRPKQSVEAGMVMEDNKTLSGSMAIKAADLDEAIQIAAACPVLLAGGTVEIRPMLSM